MNRRSGGDQSRGRGAGKPSSGAARSGKPGGPRKGTGKPRPLAAVRGSRRPHVRDRQAAGPRRFGEAHVGAPGRASRRLGQAPGSRHARRVRGSRRARSRFGQAAGASGSGDRRARRAAVRGKPLGAFGVGEAAGPFRFRAAPRARAGGPSSSARSSSGKPLGPFGVGQAAGPRRRVGTRARRHHRHLAPQAPGARGARVPRHVRRRRPKTAGDRTSLRVVRGKPGPAAKGKGGAPAAATPRPKRARRRPRGPVSVRDEILRHGGARGDRRFQAMAEASEAYDEGRERDAVRMLRPLVKAMPGAPSVRELLGLVALPVGPVRRRGRAARGLRDDHRRGRPAPGADGLRAGASGPRPRRRALARARRGVAGRRARDRGPHRARRVARRPRPAEGGGRAAVAAGPTPRPKRVQEHHLRLWYALADLEERTGNLPRARTLFDRIRRQDASFADVAERLAALGLSDRRRHRRPGTVTPPA